MPKKLNVALLVHTATAWGFQLLEGVARYAKKQDQWKILHEPGHGAHEVLRLSEEWKVDGILTQLHDPHTAAHVTDRGAPIVNMSSSSFERSEVIPRVCEDVAGMGIMAADHFADLGFKNFAYYGSFRHNFYTSLRDAFEESVKQKRGTFSCHPHLEQRQGARKRNRDKIGLKEWLASLPKPVGIFAWKSRSATELGEACHELGILIPEQVAILIVGASRNPINEILDPPVSNVVVDATEIGYRAALLLDQLMQQKDPGTAPVPVDPILVPPVGIDIRTSTDTLAIGNEHVAKAVAFIREHALEPITVADVHYLS
ncbi:MAG: XylR family transcriptional regulator, partial [Planctomycetia bacterium]